MSVLLVPSVLAAAGLLLGLFQNALQHLVILVMMYTITSAPASSVTASLPELMVQS